MSVLNLKTEQCFFSGKYKFTKLEKIPGGWFLIWILDQRRRRPLYFAVAAVSLTLVYHYCYKKNLFRKFYDKVKEGINYDPFRNVPDQNLAFYEGTIPSRPNGDYIENILKDWFGNYDKLERHHGYIQWLFPNRMPGVNSDASVLTDKEAQAISSDPVLKDRVKRSFGMMLDFYGMKLTYDNNQRIGLARNAKERLSELNTWGNHNFRRINRILLALKELGHKDLMLPWMKLLSDLIYKEKQLDAAKSSFERFWVKTLDKDDRHELERYNPLITP